MENNIMEFETKNINNLKHFENAKPWQLDCLKKNPYYTSWGNNEDYMLTDGNGWDSPIVIDLASDLLSLGCYTELVNFYFFLSKRVESCPTCNGTGLSGEARKIKNSFYGFNSWSQRLTQDEVDALYENGRLNSEKEKYGELTAELVNRLIKNGEITHDANSISICINQRYKRYKKLGIITNIECPHCNGTGSLGKGNEEVVLGLQMWILHPRKGSSRGVILSEIKEEEVKDVVKYLKEARDRNNERFSKL